MIGNVTGFGKGGEAAAELVNAGLKAHAHSAVVKGLLEGECIHLAGTLVEQTRGQLGETFLAVGIERAAATKNEA